MTYDINVHRQLVRDALLRLAAAGPGWHEYARRRAEQLVKEDPSLHQDLSQAVEQAIKANAPQRAPTRRT